MLPTSLARSVGSDCGVVGTFCTRQKELRRPLVGGLSHQSPLSAENAIEIVRFMAEAVLSGDFLSAPCEDARTPVAEVVDGEPTLWLQSGRCLIGLGTRRGSEIPFAAVVRSADGPPWERWQKELVRMALMLGSEASAQDAEARAEATTADLILSRLSVALMVVDHDLELKFQNPAAQSFVNRSPHLCERNGRLAATTSETQKSLRTAVVSTAVDRSKDFVVVKLGDASVGRPETVTVTQLKPKLPLALVVGNQPTTDPGLADMVLTTLGLTPSERRVIRMLVQGLSLEDAANAANVKLSTARSYLRKAFEKTNTNRQSELISLVLDQVPPLRATASASRPCAKPKPSSALPIKRLAAQSLRAPA